jgi:Fe-S cluster assembly protein SufD
LVHTELSVDDSTIRVNSAFEAFLGEGAFLRYAVVQKLGSQVRAFQPRLARLDRDAQIEWIVVQAGGGRVVTTNQTLLVGEGASAESYAVFLGAGDQILDFQTKMNHWASHSTSDMDSKGVMTDRAKAVYTGFTEIKKGAHGCASWQKEKTLMLSDDCRVDLIPALWIYDDDVQKAGHAAAAGQVNQEQLYYLMSRGIREKDALLLLVTGFLATILDRIPLPQVRDEIAKLAAETLSR